MNRRPSKPENATTRPVWPDAETVAYGVTWLTYSSPPCHSSPSALNRRRTTWRGRAPRRGTIQTPSERAVRWPADVTHSRPRRIDRQVRGMRDPAREPLHLHARRHLHRRLRRGGERQRDDTEGCNAAHGRHATATAAAAVPRPRSRDLGLPFGSLEPGPLDAITDVDGVRVGSVTLIEGDGPLRRGEGPVRTGVTVVVPREGFEPLFAGCHRLNGNGELTGLEWMREAGCLTTPIGLTNTHSVGVVRDALVEVEVRQYDDGEMFWSLPVVGETWDGTLNDINGFHVKAEHVHQALATAPPTARSRRAASAAAPA